MKTLGLSVGIVLAVLLHERSVSEAEATAQERDAAGGVEGIIIFNGEVPKSSTADDAGAQRELLQVDQTTHGLANVVVWLICAS